MDFNQVEIISDGTAKGTSIIDKLTRLPIEGADYVMWEWNRGELPTLLVGTKTSPVTNITSNVNIKPALTLKPLDNQVQDP